MTRTVRSQQGDTLDRLCYRHLGRTAGVTERVLALNVGLAEQGPVLPSGTAVTLPDIAPEPVRAPRVQLWD
ncbi:tail protein X [Halomonas organivorans]|uniref:Phage tail protein X n=1 Tax=Halomonas organivorans TaxID=257772 RepID=A0A7W5G683_9GAMM|nr:tail protein X [Halomonas organivorans]MBB3141201.1 phage tail protein X [Halomonas organivorans]